MHELFVNIRVIRPMTRSKLFVVPSVPVDPRWCPSSTVRYTRITTVAFLSVSECTLRTSHTHTHTYAYAVSVYIYIYMYLYFKLGTHLCVHYV